jgi:hypothetical protein
MKNSIKTVFDHLFKLDYKKKYDFRNGDETLIYFSNSAIIEISLYLTETNQYRLHISVEKDGICSGLPKIPYFDIYEQKCLADNISTDSIGDQIQKTKSFLEKNIKQLF